jgi:DNA repair protein RecN (Recombination protein N)
MLTYLRVRNLAIVEEFAIEPGPGLNVLTGETGAGKSLLIDSLQFLSGARGSTEAIRSGAGKMTAEAVFLVPEEVARTSGELGIDPSSELIVLRELQSGGRGRVLVNGTPLTVRQLSELSDLLLEIHGQDQSHGRIAGQPLQEMIDGWAGNGELLRQARQAWERWKELDGKLKALELANHDRALRLDLLSFQINEIGAARLTPGEEEALRQERAILANAQELVSASAAAWQLLDEDDLSATAQLSRAMQQIHPLTRSIDEVGRHHMELEEIRSRLRELGRSLAALGESVSHEPDRLDEIELRLALIERLRKKYGGSIEEVLAHLARVEEEFEQLEQYDRSLERLQTEENGALEAFRKVATELSSRRKAAAFELEKGAREELGDLAMERTEIRIAMTTVPQSESRLSIDGEPVAFSAAGFDRLEALIAPNRGEELRPLQKIASGGELSRIQLAIAAALFRRAPMTSGVTLVFDEIDSGVGGRVAAAVGEKLRDLATSNQVLCVTHLPQIASLGTTHFRVWKEEVEGRTRARIELLDTRQARIEEIARMLGGASVTESARHHAAELLDQAAPAPRKGRRSASVSS